MSMPTPQLPSNTDTDVSKTLVKIIPRPVLAVVGIVCLLTAVIVMLWAVSYPERFADSFVRTVFALLIAFMLAIGAFIMYPVSTRMKGLPFLPASVEVVGPIALFVAVLLVVRGILPVTSGAVYHEISGPDGGPLSGETYRELHVVTLTRNPFYLVPGENLEEPKGIVFFFRENQSEIKAKIRMGNHKEELVTFRRSEPGGIMLRLEKN
jgi:hypothetical protein